MRRDLLLTWGAVVLAAVPVTPALGDEPASASKPSIEDPARAGGPGGAAERTPQVGPAGKRELSGTVVKADARNVYLEHMGAIVPMRIDEHTRFSGEGVKSSRDLAEGQSVRASFTVKATTNVADSITVSSPSGRAPAEAGTGGTPPGGPEALPPGHPPVPPERVPGIPPERQPSPRDPGGPSVPKY